MAYAELRDRVGRQASALGVVGVSRGDRVAVLAPNSPVLLESYFGVPLAGGVLVPINTRLAPGEIAYILNHSEARVLLVDAELSPLVAPVLAQCRSLETLVVVRDTAHETVIRGVNYEAFLQTGNGETHSLTPSHEDDPISINHTSGTTGQPKGVVCTHCGAYLNALSVAREMQLGTDSTYLWTLPMFHCNGWCFPWAVTAVGATHVLLRGFDPSTVWDLIDRERVTHFCDAPTVLVSLANDPAGVSRGRQRPVRAATGGVPPSPTLIDRMMQLGVEIVHLYGLTETYGPSLSCVWWPEWNDLPISHPR